MIKKWFEWVGLKALHSSKQQAQEIKTSNLEKK